MPIKCPFCMYEIPDGATVCGHCGAYSKDIKELGLKGCLTIPIAIIGGLLAGALLTLVLMVVANHRSPGAAMPVMFFGLLILPVACAVAAVQLLPGRKSKNWFRRQG